MQDKEIIEQIIQGDSDKYRLIIDKYKNKVFGIIYSFCGQTCDCEDIAQNVFIKIFKALPKFKFESEFSTWMYRIVINEAITVSKKNKHDIVPLNINNSEDEEKSNIIDFLKSEDNTEESLIQKEIQENLHKALAQLKDNYRTVLVLRDIEDYSYEEIAKILNVSNDNVKIWIFRARTKLKEILLRSSVIPEGRNRESRC